MISVTATKLSGTSKTHLTNRQHVFCQKMSVYMQPRLVKENSQHIFFNAVKSTVYCLHNDIIGFPPTHLTLVLLLYRHCSQITKTIIWSKETTVMYEHTWNRYSCSKVRLHWPRGSTLEIRQIQGWTDYDYVNESIKCPVISLSCLVSKSPRKEVMPLNREVAAIVDQGRCIFYRVFCGGCYQLSGGEAFVRAKWEGTKQTKTKRRDKGIPTQRQNLLKALVILSNQTDSLKPTAMPREEHHSLL